jgi:CRP-like cAMP-binding protein
MTTHLAKINRFISDLDPETANALQDISVSKTYRKGDILLRQGAVCSKSYLIEQGIARKFYLANDKEITTELYFENDLAVAFDSYTLQQPGKECIEALTDLTVSITSYQSFQQAKKIFPSLVTLDLMLAEHYAMWLEERLFQLHTMTATERYAALLYKTPHIVQHVSLTVLSSYLGISLETLSRIRARI